MLVTSGSATSHRTSSRTTRLDQMTLGPAPTSGSKTRLGDLDIMQWVAGIDSESAYTEYARRRSDGRHGSSLSQGARQT